VADGRTDLDKLVGAQPEDVIAKAHPTAGKKDPAIGVVDSGGTSKLPDPPKPFTLGGK